MRLQHLLPFVLVGSLLPSAALAQSPGTRGADDRVTVGLVRQGGTFGDDGPRDADAGLGLVVGLGFRRDPTGLAGLAFDLAFEPTAVPNPHFNERVRRLHVNLGLEIGRQVYVRPMAGLVVNFWAGDTQQALGFGPSVGVAAGFQRRTSSGLTISPEWVTRVGAEWGAVTWSSGVQLAIGTPGRP